MTSEEALQTFGLPASPDHRTTICELLKQETEQERLGKGQPEILRTLCAQLFSIGQVNDSLLIWRAKRSSFDMGFGLDIQFLCGAGLDKTKAFLTSSSDPDAKAALDYLLKCEVGRDFEDWSPEKTLNFHRRYYGLIPSETSARLSYEDSCRAVEAYGGVRAGETPPIPRDVPRHDAETLGVSFFRTRLENATLENLTLPRTFFGRSSVSHSSFAGSDLSRSNLCWNDFKGVSFRGTALNGADLRASTFQDCDFTGCNLTRADLRRSTFTNCHFDNAIVVGALIPRRLRISYHFSEKQRRFAKWVFLGGPPPDGG